MRRASSKRRLARPWSWITDLPLITKGMIPAGRPAGGPGRRTSVAGGGHCYAGVAEVVEEGLQADDDRDRGGGAALPWQAGGGQVLQERAERLAAAPRQRQVVDVAEPVVAR